MEYYEIINSAMFDNYVEYKGVKIYPITIQHYNLVKSASCAFAVSSAYDTDIELIGLPTMEYLMKKAIKDSDFLIVWNIFNSILQLSFKEQIFSFKYKGDFLRLIVHVPTENYNEENMCVYRKKLNEYNKLARNEFYQMINENQLKKLQVEIEQLANKMFVDYEFDDNDYEEIKKIICCLNDIDDTVIDPKWEEELKKASKIMNEINAQNNPPELEDLIDAVAFHLHKLPNEIRDMTVRRFDRYLEIELGKENYILCKTAEGNGAQFKQKISHWLTKYKPKGRYSAVQSNSNNLHEMLK